MQGRPGLYGTNSSKNFQFEFLTTKLNRFSIFCTNIIGNSFPSSYLFLEFIYFNPVINYNFQNDQISFCRTGKWAGVTWNNSIFGYANSILFVAKILNCLFFLLHIPSAIYIYFSKGKNLKRNRKLVKKYQSFSTFYSFLFGFQRSN